MSSLSGRKWWFANQARFFGSRDINDLAGNFRNSVSQFISVLRDAGANVWIVSTRRNADRAYLMHYSWRIAYGLIDASGVPARPGVDIQWDHGNDKASRRAAQDMVNLFDLHHEASLASNHIRGLAIDMDIIWYGNLCLGPLIDGSIRNIVSEPRNGAYNRELHEIGALFGVRKLLSDPPHWSHDGR